MTGDITAGIDDARVASWFSSHVPASVPPLEYELIAGGHSNLTYKVVDRRGNNFVLRRPPLGHVLATALWLRRKSRFHQLLEFAKTARSTEPLFMSWATSMGKYYTAMLKLRRSVSLTG